MVRTLVTGPARWWFSDPYFEAALLPVLDGRSLRIRAVVGPDESTVSVFAVSRGSDPSYADPEYFITVLLAGSFDATLDGNGFPILDAIEMEDASISIGEYRGFAFQWAGGPITAGLHLSQAQIDDDREPPVVARPHLAPEALNAAPTTLELGDRTLFFPRAELYVPYGSRERILSVEIEEEGYHYVDEVRLDFVWAVTEDDVWEPQIASLWNQYEFLLSVRDGPDWPVGTDVDIVVGFVDATGTVRLMKATSTVAQDF